MFDNYAAACVQMVTMNDENIHGIYEDIPLGTDCAFLCTFAGRQEY